MSKGSERLAEAIRRLAQGHPRPSGRDSVDVAPGCAFGVAVDQRLKDLEQGLGELKTRINGLIFLILGSVLVQVVMRLLG